MLGRAALGLAIGRWRQRLPDDAVPGAVLLTALALRLPTLWQPLVEAHTFRQTQTAYTALIFHRSGIDLLQTPMPTLGPPWVVPFEFPLFQALAAGLMDAGAPVDFALRFTSLGFFIASAALLWTIICAEVGRRAAWLVVLMFAFSPLGLLWSRSSTIETLAVASSLGSILFALKWDRGGHAAFLLGACVLGVLAALVKLPTAAVWLAPAALLIFRRRPLGAILPGVAAAAGLAWTVYADGIKAAAPATAGLTSSSLRDWTFGTVSQRFEPESWVVIAVWATALFALVILIRPSVVRDSRIGRWAALTLTLGPVVFMNLYLVHDYYWMAVAPAAAILSGLVVDDVLATGTAALRRLRLVAVFACVVVAFIGYPRVLRMFQNFDEANTLVLAEEIKTQTAPTDLVAISGRDWSPGVLYYADRRGWMEWRGSPHAPAGYVEFSCPLEGVAGDCVRIGLTVGQK